MQTKTTMINTGLWELVDVGIKYRYRVFTPRRTNAVWSIFKQEKSPVLKNPSDVKGDEPQWVVVETGFRCKESAVEYAVELAEYEEVMPVKNHLLNHVADLLNNIDDGVDLDKESY